MEDLIEVRRVLTQVETIYHEFGSASDTPLLLGTVAAVLKNPYAGHFEPNILPMMDALSPVGLDMANKLLSAMRVERSQIMAYGKGAIIGSAGELEHGALWHVPGGYAMRELLGWKGDRPGHGAETGGVVSDRENRALAIVPSTKKVGGPGTRLDVPLTHITAAYVRSHFNAVEVYVPMAPAADEVVYVLAMATGARIHARVGGLAPEGITKFDGLR